MYRNYRDMVLQQAHRRRHAPRKDGMYQIPPSTLQLDPQRARASINRMTLTPNGLRQPGFER